MTTILGAAASGMAYNQNVLDVVANNLANVNTAGFKAVRALAEGTPNADYETGGGRLGVSGTTFDPIFRAGAPQDTGDRLHFAISDDSFFRVQDADGSIAYTRFGALTADAAGNVTAFRGRFLVPPVTVPEGLSSPAVDQSGAITATDDTGAVQVIGQVGVVRFVNPQGLEELGDGLYRETVNSGALTEGIPGDGSFATIRPGSIESSNVDAAQEFTSMLIAQRAYQASARTFSVGDQMLSVATNLTR
ncbi:MAG: flagellar hook-basal body protein [Chloroflexi bacterium]|nr:flagellar hook-basal body protein [Chloroflexota bacterium]